MPSAWSSTSSTSTSRLGRGGGFSLEIVEERAGIAVVRASGKGASELFKHEAGGHRWQQVSGKKVHTSTVTVAVLREPTATEMVLHERDLEWKTCRGSGAGGQHRNTTDSAVIVKHIPSGVTVRCENERSQLQNKNTAMSVLRARLLEAKEAMVAGTYNDVRRGQLGGGARGDKRRTIQFQNGIVVDHIRERRTDVKSYLKGDLEWLA